jgi:ferredoxin-like protein FixX
VLLPLRERCWTPHLKLALLQIDHKDVIRPTQLIIEVRGPKGRSQDLTGSAGLFNEYALGHFFTFTLPAYIWETLAAVTTRVFGEEAGLFNEDALGHFFTFTLPAYIWETLAAVTTRVFGEENPTPCTLVIVPGLVAITYRTHYRTISFPYNEIRVQNIIFTSETTRYTKLVQARLPEAGPAYTWQLSRTPRISPQTNTCLSCALCPHSCAPGKDFPVGHPSLQAKHA